MSSTLNQNTSFDKFNTVLEKMSIPKNCLHCIITEFVQFVNDLLCTFLFV